MVHTVSGASVAGSSSSILDLIKQQPVEGHSQTLQVFQQMLVGELVPREATIADLREEVRLLRVEKGEIEGKHTEYQTSVRKLQQEVSQLERELKDARSAMFALADEKECWQNWLKQQREFNAFMRKVVADLQASQKRW